MNLENELTKSQYKNMLAVFNDFPLWLQHALFVDFKSNINSVFCDDVMNDFTKDEIFALYTPQLTYMGSQENNTKASKLPQSMYTFLTDASNGLNIIEMAIKNNLSLNVLANTFINTLEKELITYVKHEKILYMANYLAGRSIPVDFLCNIGKITKMELTEILNYQTRIKQKTGEEVDSINILVAKKYVSKEYVKSILKYFVDAKRKIKNINANVIAGSNGLEIENLKSLNEKLLKENKIVKDQLKKMLNLPVLNE